MFSLELKGPGGPKHSHLLPSPLNLVKKYMKSGVSHH